MIGLISINYNKAPLKIRECFSFTDIEIPKFYKFLLSKVFLDGFFILSTCNRTEIYYEKEDCFKEQVNSIIIKALLEFKSFDKDITPYIYYDYDSNAIHHFFSVASGLKSLVFGEYQIVNQIKESYYICQTNKMLGPVIEKMIHKALETGKKVRTSTNICKGAVSVSSAAVQISIKKFSNPKSIKVLNVGTGETGQLVLESLKKKGCNDITIANRTYSKALEVAKLFDAKVIEFKYVNKYIENVDIVVFSTASQKQLLSLLDIKEIMQNRINKPLLVIDVGVPRNVSCDIEKTEYVELFNLDKLKEVIADNNNNKKGEIKEAEIIVDTFVNEFEDWIKAYQLNKTFSLINNSFEEINKIQLERYKDSTSYNEIVKYGDILSRKYSKMIIKQLRIANKNGIKQESLELVEELFAFNK